MRLEMKRGLLWALCILPCSAAIPLPGEMK